MKIFFFILSGFISAYLNAQSSALNEAGILCLDSVGEKSAAGNIYLKSAFSDSLASSFVIVIKKEVKAHKHAFHSEHVMVIEGEGNMTLADKTFPVKKGDLIFIPMNTVHSVKTKGKKPLKVLSIQSPMFDGKDRIMIEEK